jgi:SAM-dependent methyltransferase
MKLELLNLLRCPVSRQTLKVDNADYSEEVVESGWLVTGDGKHRYPIHNGIPRFVHKSNYADNFGMQWNYFSKTQLDSHSGHLISADRFWLATGWKPADLRGQWVLDAGCGAGRFAEVALNAGAKVVALDYSSAADACYSNLKHHENLHVIQGDIFALPFEPSTFPFVYSLGVLQHTPNVKKAFAALPPILADGGRLCADFYWKRLQTMLHMKYLLRPITKRMSQQKLFNFLELTVPVMLPISQSLGRVPIAGKALKRLIPVADYSGIFPLSPQQLKEWALLDTFDWLAPQYDNPQTAQQIRSWFDDAGLREVEIFHGGHLVGRGKKVG